MGQTRSRKIEKRWKIKIDHEIKKRSRFFSGRETQTSALRSWKPNTTVQNYNQAGKYLCLVSQQEIYNGSLEGQGLLKLRNCVCCLCPAVCKELGCSSHLPPGSCTCRQGSGCPEPPGQADPAPWLSAHTPHSLVQGQLGDLSLALLQSSNPPGFPGLPRSCLLAFLPEPVLLHGLSQPAQEFAFAFFAYPKAAAC